MRENSSSYVKKKDLKIDVTHEKNKNDNFKTYTRG